MECEKPGVILVTVSWPDDPERGSETYWFHSETGRQQWVEDCIEAAQLGWRLLQGAHYFLHRADPPFDPLRLMEDGSSTTLAENTKIER